MRYCATLEKWIDRHYSKQEQKDIAAVGCASGFHDIIYTTDCVRLFKRYADDCLQELQEYVESVGDYPPKLKDWLCDYDRFANFLLWFAIESIVSRKTEL